MGMISEPEGQNLRSKNLKTRIDEVGVQVVIAVIGDACDRLLTERLQLYLEIPLDHK